MTMQLLLPILGYFIGAIPFGLVIGKMAGVDVRLQGSKNIGATNVSRILGKKLGFCTLVCDCLKGFLPMVVAAAVLGEQPGREFIVALTGIMTVVGHMFPVYLKFRGGKGVATGLGVFLYLSPVAVLFSLMVFLAAVALSGFVSVGSLLSSASIVLWAYLLGASRLTLFAAAVVAILIWIKHYQNIGRLLQGNEKSWKKPKEDKATTGGE
jgi:glycerol-3-phosphate acyltransferase PlsY